MSYTPGRDDEIVELLEKTVELLRIVVLHFENETGIEIKEGEAEDEDHW